MSPAPRPILSRSSLILLLVLSIIAGLSPLLFRLADPPMAMAQSSAPPVRISPYPGSQSPTTLLDNSGAGNKTLYIGYARPDQPTTSWSTAATTLTNIVVLTNSGTINFPSPHGLVPGYKIVVTGSATTALNGTYRILTTPTASSATITTSGVGDATYSDTSLSVSTDAPLMTRPIWSISLLGYDSNGIVNTVLWANGSSGNFTSIYANRAVVNGATVITFK